MYYFAANALSYVANKSVFLFILCRIFALYANMFMGDLTRFESLLNYERTRQICYAIAVETRPNRALFY